jgi:hypothetical protein
MQKQYKNKSNPAWVAVETSDPNVINLNGVPTHISMFNTLQWDLVTESLLLADLKGKKKVIECKNQNEFDQVTKITGIKWGRNTTFESGMSCIRIYDGTVSGSACGNKENYIEKGYGVIDAADFIAANTTDRHAKTMSVADLERWDANGGLDKNYYLIPKSKVNGQQS